jgi:hypothetical protein
MTRARAEVRRRSGRWLSKAGHLRASVGTRTPKRTGLQPLLLGVRRPGRRWGRRSGGRGSVQVPSVSDVRSTLGLALWAPGHPLRTWRSRSLAAPATA